MPEQEQEQEAVDHAFETYTCADKCIDIIIFDSSSSLLVYLEEKESIDWLNSLISFAEGKNINLLLFALKTDAQRAAIKQLEMRVDSTRVI